MKIYVCECGKEFDNPQRFNGHKQGCETHIILKYGSLEAYYKIKNRNRKQGGNTQHNIAVAKKEAELAQWISEQHTCEKCGKVMIAKYGSGRFCSKRCACSRIHTEEEKAKIASSINAYFVEHQKEAQKRYCDCCGKQLSHGNQNKTGYCNNCIHKFVSMSEETKQKISDIMKKCGCGGTHTSRKFIYKGISLDSSYELTVAKSLDENNIDWIRPEKLTYLDSVGTQHYYFPDFYLPKYNIYLDPKNDYLINNINPHFGYSDTEKISWVMQQNEVTILILNKDHLHWSAIQELIVNTIN